MPGKIKKKQKTSRREEDRFTVVLEAIQSDFRVFGEKLDLIDGKVERIADDVERLQGTVDRLVVEFAIVKDEIRSIKHVLHTKTNLKRLKDLEKRVERIEAMLAKR